MADPLDPEKGYSFLEEAAAEGRAESRRRWAKGGQADRKYAMHSDSEKHWPIAPIDAPDHAPRTRRGFRKGNAAEG